MRHRIEDFTAWASQLAVRLGRRHEVVPEDPHGAIGVARFRRSLAWHIARRPGGLVALAFQYGHMRTAMSAGYAARGRGERVVPAKVDQADESTLVRRELAAAVTLTGDDEHGYPLDQGVREVECGRIRNQRGS